VCGESKHPGFQGKRICALFFVGFLKVALHLFTGR
jgi:hypothetical protein